MPHLYQSDFGLKAWLNTLNAGFIPLLSFENPMDEQAQTLNDNGTNKYSDHQRKTLRDVSATKYLKQIWGKDMRLTKVLNVIFPRKRLANGLVFGGKNQKVKRIKVADKIHAANQVAMEEQNSVYLKRPCITHEEQRLYGAKHQDRRKSQLEHVEKRRAQAPFFQHMTLEDHLKPLNINKKWE